MLAKQEKLVSLESPLGKGGGDLDMTKVVEN